MTDLIGQLTARTLQLAPVVQPRLAPLFANASRQMNPSVNASEQAINPAVNPSSIESEVESTTIPFDATTNSTLRSSPSSLESRTTIPLVSLHRPVLDLAAFPPLIPPHPTTVRPARSPDQSPEETPIRFSDEPISNSPTSSISAESASFTATPQAPTSNPASKPASIPTIVPNAHVPNTQISPALEKNSSVPDPIDATAPGFPAIVPRSISLTDSLTDGRSGKSATISSSHPSSNLSNSSLSNSVSDPSSGLSTIPSSPTAIARPASIQPVLPSSPRAEIVQPNLPSPAVTDQNALISEISEKLRHRDRLDTAPVIRVTIGRIDVRTIAAPPPRAPSQPALKPQLSLADYLKSRNGGSR